jgi:hypothetical protein
LNITRARRCGLVAVGDRGLDLAPAGKGDLGLHLAGVGIEHVALTAGRPFDHLATDEMTNITHSDVLPVFEFGPGGRAFCPSFTAFSARVTQPGRHFSRSLSLYAPLSRAV